MREESSEAKQPLRSGLTTGSCATACTVAAVHQLLGQQPLDVVSITLPKGKTVEMPICDRTVQATTALAATIKDAGDDPDVTHGARVWVKVSLQDSGITLKAGQGVGTVTRTGLVLAVGEPAINPVPRKMITEHLQQLAKHYAYAGGFEVTIGVDNGEALALKTMNPRLGIHGGLSILGTTGIVRPFSCAAYIASIHQGIDVARSNGEQHIAASTGNTSEAFIAAHYHLPDMALIEMGDFVGAVLKYLKKNPLKKLSICAGFGKLTKLAQGHLDLHSRASSIDFVWLAQLAAEQGADRALCEAIQQANTSLEAQKLALEQGFDLVQPVCVAALNKVQSIIPATMQAEVWAVDRQGACLGVAVG